MHANSRCMQRRRRRHCGARCVLRGARRSRAVEPTSRARRFPTGCASSSCATRSRRSSTDDAELPGRLRRAVDRGLAHATEHMMFRGSATLSSSQLMDTVGITGGDFDADTTSHGHAIFLHRSVAVSRHRAARRALARDRPADRRRTNGSKNAAPSRKRSSKITATRSTGSS